MNNNNNNKTYKPGNIYEHDDYLYKYKYIGNTVFESKYIIVADAKCELKGETYVSSDGGDYDTDYNTTGLVRNKERWYCFLKYRDSEDDNIIMLDLILINSKLYNALPEKSDFEKLEELNWEGDGSVTICNNNLVIFDCKYFNNTSKFNIPDNIKTMPHPWYEYISRSLMKHAESIMSNTHGVALFIDNGDYEIYNIKDTKTDEVLGVDIELHSGMTDDASDLFESDLVNQDVKVV